MELLTADELTGDASPEVRATDPIGLCCRWLEAAASTEPSDPNAMALATTGTDGVPNVRMVLLKSCDVNGFVFYTNCQSQKGIELAANMQAAAVLHWKTLGRQVRLRGPVEYVSNAHADAYFATRPRDSQIAAWASRQSDPLENRMALNRAVELEAIRFGSSDVPRPPYWRGYRIRPLCIEFWIARPFRLHDRVAFRRQTAEASWRGERLYP